MNPEQHFKSLYEDMFHLCKKNDWGDPFSYARSREIHIAGTLGHKVSSTLSGADGIDEDGECEYKSTIGKYIQATYNGISVQPTWDEQVHYLYNKKIAKYKNHYIVRYDGPKIAEIWKLSGIDVFKILFPKLEKKYATILEKKDPRLGANLTRSEIYEYGVEVEYNK